MAFIKVVENFVCGRCGAFVEGSGYTNHCPRCLWSKHVDIEPGDRASSCGGLMEPLRLEGSSPTYDIIHQCTRCGFERRNQSSPSDNPQALTAIAKARHVGNNS